MSGQVEPVFVRTGPMLDWFPGLFAAFPWIVKADEFAPGVPHRDMAPRVLERFVIEEASYEQRDLIWEGIVTRSRQPNTASVYQLIALGVAAKGLISFRNRLRIHARAELADVDADLVLGLLRRLSTININARNVGGRLIDSAAGYAHRRWHQHLNRPTPTDLDPDQRAAGPDRRGLQAAFDRLLDRLAADGQPLDAVDVELIASTRFDRHTMIETAVRLRLPVEAAYKRRQRAERRIAAFLRRSRPASLITSRSEGAVSGHRATAAEAPAGSSTRRTAAAPTTR